MAKNYKKVEKNLTTWWGALGLPTKRQSRERFGEAVEDIAAGPLSVEVKSRKQTPAYVQNWMDQAVENSDGRIPVVHWHRDNARYDNDLIILRAQDLRKLVTAMWCMAENNIDGIRVPTETTINDYLQDMDWMSYAQDILNSYPDEEVRICE